MGCGSPLSVYPGGSFTYLNAYALVDLTDQDVLALTKCFRRMDKSALGGISFDMLHSFYSIDESPYIKHIFRQTLRDPSCDLPADLIPLRSFILDLWLFLTLDETGLLDFTFQMLDVQRTHRVSKAALREWLVLAYGRDRVFDNLDKVVLNMKPDADLNDEKLTFSREDLKSAVKYSPHLIQHALQLQERLRSKILGRAFWKNKNRECLRRPEARALFARREEEVAAVAVEGGAVPAEVSVPSRQRRKSIDKTVGRSEAVARQSSVEQTTGRRRVADSAEPPPKHGPAQPPGERETGRRVILMDALPFSGKHASTKPIEFKGGVGRSRAPVRRKSIDGSASPNTKVAEVLAKDW